MPVVTTRPRGLAASAGGTAGKGPSTFPGAGKILFASRTGTLHTFSMSNRQLLAAEYVAVAVAAYASSPARGRSVVAIRAADEAGV